MAGLIVKFQRLNKRLNQINELVQRVDDLQKAFGCVAAEVNRQNKSSGAGLQEYEFKVFSQWGEDGIIQYLIHQVEIRNKIFVEFGVQDYRESNTRFLLQNDNWSGLVIDASSESIERIKAEPIYFRNDLRAVCAFIDRENINDLLGSNGIKGDIGILSVDIDGNDYWVWEAINCVQPRIVICEYDSLLGDERKVTTPYDKNFVRLEAHYSFLYGGASIAAMEHLGRKKGYSLVGSNSAGNNLFFVRNDVVGKLKVLTPKEAYVRAKFRNSHDRQGNLSFLGFDDSLQVIKDLPLYDLEKNAVIKVSEIIKN